MAKAVFLLLDLKGLFFIQFRYHFINSFRQFRQLNSGYCRKEMMLQVVEHTERNLILPSASLCSRYLRMIRCIMMHRPYSKEGHACGCCKFNSLRNSIELFPNQLLIHKSCCCQSCRNSIRYTAHHATIITCCIYSFYIGLSKIAHFNMP